MKDLISARLTVLVALFSVVAVHLSPAIAAPASQLITCIDLQSGKERISKSGSCRVTHEAQAKWHLVQSDSPIATGSTSKSLTICSNKESSSASYQIIRNKCARHQVSTLYSRSTALASKPIIAQAVSYGHDSSQISLAQDPATNPDAPIAYYTITSSKGNTQKLYSWRELNLVMSGLQALTTYTFTVTATTVDGTSPVSAASIPVTTPAYVPPAPTVTSSPTAPSPPVAAPAFTLSSTSESTPVNDAASGFTINSTGGGIASFAISATPPGMTFNTSTGALSGTPTTIAGATSYTVTATNTAGTASQIFTLTVTVIGSIGPGGGRVFYQAITPFACGPSLESTCTYLEAAPYGWFGSGDPIRSWAPGTISAGNASIAVNNAGVPETATATGIGWGYRNTKAIILQGNSDSATSAAQLADEYTNTVNGQNISDWYLPSKDELTQLYLQQNAAGGGFAPANYWSSSEFNSYAALTQRFWTNRSEAYAKYNSLRVRPIRAF